jgi:hypothetical protein
VEQYNLAITSSLIFRVGRSCVAVLGIGSGPRFRGVLASNRGSAWVARRRSRSTLYSGKTAFADLQRTRPWVPHTGLANAVTVTGPSVSHQSASRNVDAEAGDEPTAGDNSRFELYRERPSATEIPALFRGMIMGSEKVDFGCKAI